VDFPDIVKYPVNWKVGDLVTDRVGAILDRCEPVLGVDRSKGERGWIHKTILGFEFVSKVNHDTYNYPSEHYKNGQCRFRMVTQEDGSEHGYLIDKPEVSSVSL
jgi:hypothetical protein